MKVYVTNDILIAIMKLNCQSVAPYGVSMRLVPNNPPTAEGITEIAVMTANIFRILLVSNDV